MAIPSEESSLDNSNHTIKRHALDMLESIRDALNSMDNDELNESLIENYPPNEPRLKGERTERELWEHEKHRYRGEFTRGGNSVEDGGTDDNDSSDGVPRSEHWFAHTEEQVAQNTKITMKNRTLLNRIDERTALLMRVVFAVLLALVVAILGGLAVQLLMV